MVTRRRWRRSRRGGSRRRYTRRTPDSEQGSLTISTEQILGNVGTFSMLRYKIIIRKVFVVFCQHCLHSEEFTLIVITVNRHFKKNPPNCLWSFETFPLLVPLYSPTQNPKCLSNFTPVIVMPHLRALEQSYLSPRASSVLNLFRGSASWSVSIFRSSPSAGGTPFK